MKSGLVLGFVGGAFLGLVIGFVAFSGGADAEALHADLGLDAGAVGSSDEEVDAALGPDVVPAPSASSAPVERVASVAPSVRERSASHVGPAGDGVIEGTVTDEGGAPVAGVVVRADKSGDRTLGEPDDVGGAPKDRSLDEEIEEAAKQWHERQTSRAEATTDAAGAYRIERLVDGKYRVQAYRAGYAIEARSGSAWSVRPGTTVNFKAARVVELPLAVTLPGGAPIERVGLRRKITSDRGQRSSDFLWRRDMQTLRVAPGPIELKAFVDEALARELGVPEMTSDEKTVEVREGVTPDRLVLQLRPQRGIRGSVIVPDDVPFGQARAVLLPAPASGAIDLELFSNSDSSTWLSGGRREFEFLDLKPGKYAVGISRGWNSPALAYGVADVTDGVVSLEVELPAADASSGLVVRLRNHIGDAVDGQMFSYRIKTGNSSHSSHLESQARGPGEYWLEFDTQLKGLFDQGAFPAGTEVSLTVHSKKLGTKQVPVTAGRREIDVVFLEPATLNVTVAGYVGSGYEGQLYVKLVNAAAENNYFVSSGHDSGLAADGTETLGPVEIGTYELQLLVRDRRAGYWNDRSLTATTVRLVAGTNAATIAVPPLYALTVRFDEPGGSLQITGEERKFHLSRQVTEDVVELTMLPAGKYTLQRWGSNQNGTMLVTLPGPSDVRFALSVKNGFQVHIQNPEAWLAQVGFESNDVIIAFAGKEFADESEMRELWANGVKAGERGVTVLRKGARVNIDVTLQDLMIRGEDGAKLWPVAR